MTRDELVTQNMDKVDAAVGHVLKQFPEYGYFKDDLFSAGYLALVEAAGKIDDSVEDEAAYLYASIERDVKKALDEEGEIRIPRDSKRKLRKRGQAPDLQFTQADVSIEPDRSGELYEEILACCATENEKIVISLKRQGYTQAEIAAKIGLSEAGVCRCVQIVEERFEERSNG